MAFLVTQKVLFRHCDPAGIVFFPRYYEMANDVIEAWFDTRLGRSFEALHAGQRFAVPTARIETDFTAPSRHGDTLEFRLELHRAGTTSLTVELTAQGGDSLRLRSRHTLVYVNGETGRATPWPDGLRAALQHELKDRMQDAP